MEISAMASEALLVTSHTPQLPRSVLLEVPRRSARSKRARMQAVQGCRCVRERVCMCARAHTSSCVHLSVRARASVCLRTCACVAMLCGCHDDE
jgi:hypothetical protein